MAKGKLKRRKSGTQFQPGNQMSPLCRKPQTYQQSSSSCEDEPRPSTSASTVIQEAPMVQERRHSCRLQQNLETEEIHHGNRIIDLDMLISNINQMFTDHRAKSPKCKQLRLSLHKDYKQGMAVTQPFKCVSCEFVSDKHEMT